MAECPKAQFIPYHGIKPNIAKQEQGPWTTNIQGSAEHPNLLCKLSGLITKANHQNWHLAHFHPYVHHLLNTFGPNQLIFNGDWPVVSLAYFYRRSVEAKCPHHLWHSGLCATFHPNRADRCKLKAATKDSVKHVRTH